MHLQHWSQIHSRFLEISSQLNIDKPFKRLRSWNIALSIQLLFFFGFGDSHSPINSTLSINIAKLWPSMSIAKTRNRKQQLQNKILGNFGQQASQFLDDIHFCVECRWRLIPYFPPQLGTGHCPQPPNREKHLTVNTIPILDTTFSASSHRTSYWLTGKWRLLVYHLNQQSSTCFQIHWSKTELISLSWCTKKLNWEKKKTASSLRSTWQSRQEMNWKAH